MSKEKDRFWEGLDGEDYWKDIMIFKDRLLEAGDPEGEFWDEVVREGWRPNKQRFLFSHGEESWDWYCFGSHGNGPGYTEGHVPERLFKPMAKGTDYEKKYFIEFASRQGAYTALLKAWWLRRVGIAIG